nr:type II toxin-antitoxin system PemK/MazF family toxin [Thomasclavelia sp.]
MNRTLERGEVYLADLNPVIGNEQGGIRPVLIIQNDVGNIFSNTTIVASMTSYIRHKPNLPTHVYIKNREGLSHNSLVLLEQIRTIDKKRLIRRLCKLKYNEMEKIDICLLVSIGIENTDQYQMN